MVEKYPPVFDPSFPYKRSKVMTAIVYNSLALYVKHKFEITYKNADRLTPFKDQACFLLPKHQLWEDIVLEEMLLTNLAGRHGYQVMSSSLPKWFELLGGVSITRKRDLKLGENGKGKSDYEKRTIRDRVKLAQEQKRQVAKTVANLLLRNEIVVVHPEGTRVYQAATKINVPTIRHLLEIQELTEKAIPFVPLDIVYNKSNHAVQLSVGIPITVPSNSGGLQDLVDHLAREISLLEK